MTVGWSLSTGASAAASVSGALVPSLQVLSGPRCFPAWTAAAAGDPSVFTFSMHCGDQTFPTVVQQSDWDVPLPAGTGDEQYLQVCC